MNNEIPPRALGFWHEDKSNQEVEAYESAENHYRQDFFLNEGLEESVRAAYASPQSASSNTANRDVVGAETSSLVTPQAVPFSHHHVAEKSTQVRDTDRERTTATKDPLNENAAAQEDESKQGQKKKAHPSYVVQDVLGPPSARFIFDELDDEAEDEALEIPGPFEPIHPVLSPSCFYGPLGEITEAIAPHTEADRAAILTQMITGFGSLVGYSPHFWVGSTCHYTNLFTCIVGRTSKARKGTSFSYIREGFKIIEPAWVLDRIHSGASSGEGIIWSVRDPITKNEPLKDKGKFTGEYVQVIIDQGISDKRLLLLENEFARPLTVMGRDHNTLSEILRDAWDHMPLESMSKHDPGRAQQAHISIVAHITAKELIALLKDHAFFNGFANRFLWVCARRANYLPEPPSFADLELASYFEYLKKVALWASQVGEMERHEAARKIWNERYRELSAEGDGKFGAATDRAEAQVLRLAMIYALSTGARVIDVQAQEAAFAMWKYCEDSARFLFDDTLTKSEAKRILAGLRFKLEGMTNSEIHNQIFKRNVPARLIKQILESLKALGVVTSQQESTGGREATRWSIRGH
jgi:hypothetical protein